jgi:hypothetical protein
MWLMSSKTKRAVDHLGGVVFLMFVLGEPVVASGLLPAADGQNRGELSIPCPAEGLFTGPLELAPELPNPSAGWDLYLEGTPARIELSPPRSPEGFWLISCYYGEFVEISAHVRGSKTCRLSPNEGVITPLKDGGQSCLFDRSTADATRNSCIVTCK